MLDILLGAGLRPAHRSANGGRQRDAAGQTFTGGRPTDANDQAVVRFAEKHGRQQVNLTSATRPDLAALVAAYRAEAADEKAANEARWQAERAARAAADAPLLTAMHAEEAQFVAQIPADHVRVDVVEGPWADGQVALVYRANGVALTWQQVTRIGTAEAIRPGALGAFATAYVVSISRADLAAKRAQQQARAAERQAQAAARREALLTLEIPAVALDAYRQYHGDKEAAWDAEDEQAWGLIAHYAEAIAVQQRASVPVRMPRADALPEDA